MELQKLQKLLQQQSNAPVHLWKPEYCGEMDLQIKSDGSWWYAGSPITRAPLIKLFSRVIKKENVDYFLVTPVEKLKIQVEDFPFIANWLDVVKDPEHEHPWLILKTNVGDQIQISNEFPLLIKTDKAGNPIPTIKVRSNLFAKLSRPVFYELVEISKSWDNNGKLHRQIYSGSHWFDLGSEE